MGYKETVLADNPIGYWRLGEASTPAADSGSGGHAGTLHAVTTKAAALIAGDPDLAMDFDGVNSFIDGGALGSRSVFSVEAWVKPNGSQLQFAAIFTDQFTTKVNYALSFQNAGLVVSGGFYDGVAWHNATGTLADGQRTHVIVTYDGSTIQLYINNVAQAPVSFAASPTSDGTGFYIGQRWGGGGTEKFKGVIDEVAIYATALSPARVAAHYNAGITPGVGAGPNLPAGNAPLLRWRILDPVTGVVLIDPLPHPHQSWFRVTYPQSGSPGDTAIGEFEIPLFPPDSDDHEWAQVDYDKIGLSYYQRCEAYLTHDDLQGAAGDPVFSGVITQLPKDTGRFAIGGKDSLYLAKVARTGKSEAFNGTTDTLFSYALKAYSVAFGDDFSGTLAAWTNSGWTQTTDEGYQSIKSADGVAGTGLIYTNSSFANSLYADCAVDADFHNSGTAHGECGVVAALADANNYILGSADKRGTSSGWSIDARISQISAGVETVRARIQGALSLDGSNGEAHLQVRLIGLQLSSTSYQWRLVINGVDVNCVWTQTVTAGNPIGSVGAFSKFTNGINGTPVYIHGASATAGQSGTAFVFLSKSNVFLAGSVGAGTQSIKQVLALQPPIDLMNLAMSTEGWYYRKNPKTGLNKDTMDFTASPGTDLSKSVVFVEGDNLLSCEIESNAEPPNSALVGAGHPGPEGSGAIVRYNLPAIQKHGLVMGLVPIPSAIHQVALRAQTDQILRLRATPGQAKRLRVLRDVSHATTASSPTGLLWREGDFITVHAPRLGLNHLKVQVVGFRLAEGDAQMDVECDQYPGHLDRILALDRLKQSVESLMSGRDDYSGLSITDGIIYDRRIVLPLHPFKAQAVQNAAQAAIATATFAKIVLQAENYDPSNSFDNTTNYRFVAPVPGFYYVAGSVPWTPGAGNPKFLTTIYKNGAEIAGARGYDQIGGATTGEVASCPIIVYLAAGEYVELWAQQITGGNLAPANGALDLAILTVHLVSGGVG